MVSTFGFYEINSVVSIENTIFSCTSSDLAMQDEIKFGVPAWFIPGMRKSLTCERYSNANGKKYFRRRVTKRKYSQEMAKNTFQSKT